MVKGWAQHTGGATHEIVAQGDVDVLWNNRDKSNNILKLEFEMCAASIPSSLNGYMIDYINVRGKNNPPIIKFGCSVSKVYSSIAGRADNIYDYNHTWIKVEMYIDYNTNILYYHVPNHFTEKEAKNSIEEPVQIILNTYFNGTFLGSAALIKYDNFKVSAIPALPNYLSVDDFVSSKFSVFPNPATDIVMITNSENIGIEQVEVFDVSGKIIKSQNFNSENEVLLNIGDFAVGMYLLHIKTNEGKAVKKMVKK